MTALTWPENTSLEAAYIADVNERDIHRLVDEEILPRHLLETSRTQRRFDLLACVLGAFYFQASRALTKEARRRVMDEIVVRWEKWMATRSSNHEVNLAALNWSITIDSVLSVNVQPVAQATAQRAAQLARLKDMVQIHEDVLDGEPVFSGTRVPVRTVADWLNSGETHSAILEAFPRVTQDMIDLAPLWVRTHPQRGRPKKLTDHSRPSTQSWKKLA
jgi:uncharacterized protein (DUF433 family)